MSKADSATAVAVTRGAALSIAASQRHPLHRLDAERVVIHGERCVEVIHVRNPVERRCVETGHSIGSVAVSDDGALLAIAERSRNAPPRVVIFSVGENGEFTEIVSLNGGAQRRYDCLDFSKDAEILATVSGQPDHQLTLWDWRRGEVMLRAKAFSQDVFTVRFSRLYDRQLITSGTGHIKFWTLANTFSGMKLQGALGKFGRAELVDIPDFAEIDNGCVVSGTETGDLLLWRECLIQAVIRSTGGTPCHASSINYLTTDRSRHRLWTASADGCIKEWDAKRLSSPEPLEDRDSVVIESTPVQVISLGDLSGAEQGRSYAISSFLLDEESDFIVFLQSGGVVRLACSGSDVAQPRYTVCPLWDFIGGDLTEMCLFEKGGAVACASTDGTVTLFDTEQRRLLYRSSSFSSGATCLAKIPSELDPEERHCVVGFADGTVRVLKRCLDGWKLVCAMKPHKASVEFVQFSSDWAVTGCSLGRLFFYRVVDCCLSPYGMIQLPLESDLPPSMRRENITASCVLTGGGGLIAGTARGRLFHVEMPTEMENPKGSRIGYDIDCSITLLQLPELVDRDDELGRVLSIGNLDLGDSKTRLLVSYKGTIHGWVAVVTLEGTTCTKVTVLDISATIVCLSPGLDSTHWLLGTDDGRVVVGRIELSTDDSSEVRWIEETHHSLHDCETGSIAGVALLPSSQSLISAAVNGSILVTPVPWLCPEKDGRRAEYLPLIAEDPVPEASNIIGSETFSIDEAQEKEAQKLAEKHALQKKERIRHYIQDLRRQLIQLKKENAARPENEQLPDSAFAIDTGLEDRMEKLLEQQIAAARDTFEYDFERAHRGLQKLQKRFFGGNEAFVETISGLASAVCVASFPIESLDPSFQMRFEQLTTEINRREQPQTTTPDALASTHSGNEAEIPSVVAEIEGCTALFGRSLSRKLREERIRGHEMEKPKDDEENAADIEAIKHAKDTLGDLKLKTESVESLPKVQFIPTPESDRFLKELRECPMKKELELMELEISMYRRSVDFNNRFKEMQIAKENLISEIRVCDRLLLKLRKEDATAERAETESVPSSENLVLDTESKEERLSREVAQLLNEAQTFLHKAEIPPAADPPPQDSPIDQGVEGVVGDRATPLMVQHTIEQLQKRRSEAIAAFDHDLHQLSGEMLDIDCNLKYGQLMRIVKSNELSCLKSFQAKEDSVDDRISTKLDEKRILGIQIHDFQSVLDQKTSSQTFQHQRQEVQKRFDQTVPETDAFRAHLLKLFNAKADVRRDDGSATESDSSLEDDALSDDDIDAVSLGDLDEGLRSAVSALRDERLQIEMHQQEAMRETDSIRKEKEIRSKKLKTVEASLAALECEMQRCQSEKQTELNAIQTAIVLKPSQIETTSSNEVMLSAEDTVVLHREQLKSLEERPQAIEQEMLDLKQRHQGLKLDFLQLKRDRETKRENLEHLNERLEEIQVLKFGQVIDLDAVDAAQAEHRCTLQRADPPEHVPAVIPVCSLKSGMPQELILEKQIRRIDSEIGDIEGELQVEIQRNTELLEDLSNHKVKSLKVERSTLKRHPETDRLESSLIDRERTRLEVVKEIRERAKTIAELKSHLDRFKRKDSWILC